MIWFCWFILSLAHETEVRGTPGAGGQNWAQNECIQDQGDEDSITHHLEKDAEARCRKSQTSFGILRTVWRSKCISLWSKQRIFDSDLKSVLLYGAETWRPTKRIIAQLQAFNDHRLRYILAVWLPKRISNEDVWQRTNQHRIKVSIGTTSLNRPLSGTLKGPGGGADPESRGEEQCRRNMRTLGCHGMK